MPKLADLKEYAPLFTLLSLLWTMALTGWAKLYTWREQRRREEKEREDKQIAQVVHDELAKSGEERNKMLGTIIDTTNGRYLALERKLEIETAKSTNLAVKLLEAQSETIVLSQLLGIRRAKRKKNNDSA